MTTYFIFVRRHWNIIMWNVCAVCCHCTAYTLPSQIIIIIITFFRIVFLVNKKGVELNASHGWMENVTVAKKQED